MSFSSIGNYNPTLGLYPGSDKKYDQLFGQEASAVQEVDQAAPGILPGSNWEVEGTDLGNEGVSTMREALNMNSGDNSGRAMQQYVDDSDASLYDTDYTSLAALARNARYADQIGSM
jgi:hypothetical protein